MICKNCKHEIEYITFENPLAKPLEGWHHSKEKNCCGTLTCDCGCVNPEPEKEAKE